MSYEESRRLILKRLADAKAWTRQAERELRDLQECTCTDSLRSVLGTCPERGHREYHSCPKRKSAQFEGDTR